MSGGPGLRAAVTGGLLLGWATPPAAAPGAEWLVLPALALWFAVASEGRRPGLHGYLFGCVHMAWFSWSVRHVMLPAYAAIVLVGGLYYLLAARCVRAAPRGLRGACFGLAVAGSCWLRASMPEIHYPHGQPCHSFYEWPVLMRAVAVGGEPLANALLAWIAAAAVGVWRSWRVATPAWGAAKRRLLGAVAVAVAVVAAGNAVVFAALRAGAADAERVELLLVEPGYRPDAMLRLPPVQWRAWTERFESERLVDPTRAALSSSAPVDLVVWPESSVQGFVSARRVAEGRASIGLRGLPDTSARLLLGANLRRDDRSTPAAFLVDLPRGEVRGYHAKQELVPGGEFLPLLGALPAGWSEWLGEQFRAALGALPDAAPGALRPPLETAGGVPFGALICYDNAFPGPAARQVARGARFLVVISNEAWYRGGAELQQLVAMSVVRACEGAVPIARATMDGWTVWIDAAGRLQRGLELDHDTVEGRARTLRVSVPLGAGKPPLLGWLRGSSGAASGLLMVAGALLGWGARRRHRS
ncbi:MAG: apolipoprotein N-acyltransferase [Planctomycetota bacterium]